MNDRYFCIMMTVTSSFLVATITNISLNEKRPIKTQVFVSAQLNPLRMDFFNKEKAFCSLFIFILTQNFYIKTL